MIDVRPLDPLGFAGVPACCENSGPITSPIAVMEAARLAGGRVNRAPQRPTSSPLPRCSICANHHSQPESQGPQHTSQGYTTLHQPKIVRICCSSPPIHPARPWKTLGKTLSGSGSVPTLVRVSSVVCLFMLELQTRHIPTVDCCVLIVDRSHRVFAFIPARGHPHARPSHHPGLCCLELSTPPPVTPTSPSPEPRASRFLQSAIVIDAPQSG